MAFVAIAPRLPRVRRHRAAEDRRSSPRRRAGGSTSVSPRLPARIARGLVVVGREAGVGALAEQQLHHVGVDGIGSRGEHQRRIAADVPDVHVGAAIEQQLYGFGASCAGRVAERCLTELRPRARIRAAVEQQLHGAAGCRSSAAPISAVAPAPFLASTCAPLSIKRRIASTSPRSAAALSGVRPLSVATLDRRRSPAAAAGPRIHCQALRPDRPACALRPAGSLTAAPRAMQQANLASSWMRPEEGRRPAPVLRVDVRSLSMSNVRLSSVPNPAA